MMEDVLVSGRTENLVGERKRAIRNAEKLSAGRTIIDRAPITHATGMGESFSSYINWSEFRKDSSVLVLSPTHHYYYDIDELKGVKTIINLKRLNFMNHLESFFHVIGDILSPDARFIGCFADQKTQRGIGMHSRIYKRLITFLDGRTDIKIEKGKLLRLIESCGFGIIDMTEINGLTYFTISKCGS
jgi:hypothetical protein